MPIKIFLILSLILTLHGCLEPNGTHSAQENLNEDLPPSFQGTANNLLEVGELLYINLNAIDPEGGTLIYTTRNLPSWLTLDPDLGSITGTPQTQDIGLYEDIRINISDGNNTATAGPFYIQVEQELFNIELSWEKVTQDEESNFIANDVAGYLIYMTEPSGRYDTTTKIKGGDMFKHQINRLAPGAYTFTMASYLNSGLKSNRSEEKAILL